MEPSDELVLKLEKPEQMFKLLQVPEQPTLSVLRNFSAPVKLQVEGQTEKDLTFLLAHDTDSFSKWEASQALQRGLILKLYAAVSKYTEVLSPPHKPSRICQTFLNVSVQLVLASAPQLWNPASRGVIYSQFSNSVLLV